VENLYGGITLGDNGCDTLEILVETKNAKTNISLYISTIYLGETYVERCKYGSFCWDRIDKLVSAGWHNVEVIVNSDGTTSMFIDGKFVNKLKLKLKGIKGRIRIFASYTQLGVDYIRISKEI